MEYKWDIKDIKKRYKDLQKQCILPKEELSDLEQIISDKNSYEYYFKKILHPFLYYQTEFINEILGEIQPFILKRKTIINGMESPLLNDYLLKNEKELIKQITNRITLIKNIKEPLDSKKKTLTWDEILTALHTAYQELGPHFYKRFCYYIDPSNHYLDIEKESPKNKTNLNGYVWKDYTNNISYGKIFLENNWNGVITIGHEIFHMIILEGINYNKSEEINPYLNEIEGDFFNSFLCSFIKKYDSKEEGEIFQKENIWKYIVNARDFYQAFYICKNLKEEKSLVKAYLDTKEELKKKEFQTDLTFSNFLNMTKISLTETLKDLTSYLAALELFEIYKQDEETALNKLIDITRETGPTFPILEKYSVSFTKNNFKTLKKELSMLD